MSGVNPTGSRDSRLAEVCHDGGVRKLVGFRAAVPTAQHTAHPHDPPPHPDPYVCGRSCLAVQPRGEQWGACRSFGRGICRILPEHFCHFHSVGRTARVVIRHSGREPGPLEWNPVAMLRCVKRNGA